MRGKRLVFWVILLLAAFVVTAGGCGGGGGDSSNSSGGGSDVSGGGDHYDPAAPPTNGNWIDDADTSWYDLDWTDFAITNAEELAGLAKLVNDGNNFSGQTITMTADIDLAGKEWTPIANDTGVFAGTFDGGAYAIDNLTINRKDAPQGFYGGLFGINQGALKNIRLTNAYISVSGAASSSLSYSSSNDSGGLAGLNIGTIEECVADVYVYASSASVASAHAGGIAGSNVGKIERSSANGDVSSFGSSSAFACAGGLVGSNSGMMDEGGIIKDSAANVNAYASSTYGASDAAAIAGGLIGINYSGTIEGCVASGRNIGASNRSHAYWGGFIARNGANTTLINNRNETGVTPAIARDYRYDPWKASDDI